MSIKKRTESIMVCMANIYNTGGVIQKDDYIFINKQIEEIKKEAADAQPIKHGRWFHINNDGIVYCSECNNEAYWDTDYGQQLFDYCPYCGAKMIKDGDKE